MAIDQSFTGTCSPCGFDGLSDARAPFFSPNLTPPINWQGGWICSRCGASNAPFMVQCTCVRTTYIGTPTINCGSGLPPVVGEITWQA